jgi:hypothetical protein
VSLLATRQDFEPANPAEGAAALYYAPVSGEGYDCEGMRTTLQLRIDSLKGRFAPSNQKLAVWGCGWGWLVDLAVTAGYDAHGYDASQYAITKAQASFPALSGRFHLRDALVSADMTPARRDAGLQGAQRFALLVTEDLLECMSDAEIAVTLPLLRGICSANLGHIVTPLDPWGQAHGARQDVNWKTYQQWKALLSPPDLVIGADGATV